MKADHETDLAATPAGPDGWISYDPKVHFTRRPGGTAAIWRTPDGFYWFGVRAPGAKLTAGPAQSGTRETLEEAKRAAVEALHCEEKRRAARAR